MKGDVQRAPKPKTLASTTTTTTTPFKQSPILYVSLTDPERQIEIASSLAKKKGQIKSAYLVHKLFFGAW